LGELGHGVEVYQEREVRGEFEVVSGNKKLNFSLDCITSAGIGELCIEALSALGFH